MSETSDLLDKHPWLKPLDCLCDNCLIRPATERWGGANDSVSLARNPHLARPWCKRCVLITQRDYMRTLVPKLTEVERELEILDAIDKSLPPPEGTEKP